MKALRAWWRARRPEALARIVPSFIRSVCRTMRVGTEGFPEDESKVIYCGWHGKSMLFAHHFRDRGHWVIISQSRDGDMQNGIFTRLGFRTIRGSTGRGGAQAAVEAIRALRKGGTLAMTPDGPRGP